MKTKKFVMTFEAEGESITCNATNNGFTAPELIGLLEVKKLDIIDQMNHPEMFKRYYINESGERMQIIKEDSQQN